MSILSFLRRPASTRGEPASPIAHRGEPASSEFQRGERESRVLHRFPIRSGMTGMAGFTLFEILIVLAFIAVIGSVGLGYYFNYQRQVTLRTTAETIGAFIYTTQQKSIGQEESSQWGVHFENPAGSGEPFYASFKGVSYTEASEKRYLDNALDFLYPADGESADIIFSRITGKVADGNFKKVQILLTPGTAVKAVNVSPIGVITINDGEVGWWKMDEGSGTTAGDSSGYGNTATLSGATWTTGKSVNAIHFDGLDDYVNAGTSSVLKLTGDMTWSAWINLHHALYPIGTTNWEIINSEVYKVSGFLCRIDGASGKIYARTNQAGTASGVTANTSLTINDWHHVVVSKSGTSAKIYLDGKLDGSGTLNNPVVATNFLGIGGPGQKFDGVIDDLRIYDHGLSADEVKHLYETTK